MRLLYISLFFAFLQSSSFLSAQTVNYETVAKKLLEKMETSPEDFHSVHILFTDQVDLQALDAQLSTRRSSPTQRAEAVITALKDKAATAQGEFISMLANNPSVESGSVHSYWVTNVIFAKMKNEMVATLSRHPGVAWIGLNGKLQPEKYEYVPAPPVVPNGVEPGLKVVNAPALWAMGYTGYGRVAFTNDSGIDPSHPALTSRYRGLYVPKQQTWFALDSNTFEPTTEFTPYDCLEHGTHVTGTILGLDRMKNDTIGVAFNAQWIGSAILCGIGTEDNVAAFQWSLDPDGNPATSEDMPDIVNNSWYDSALDTTDCYSIYVAVEEAMEAAGIAVVFSAGNAGPGPSTITPPHNINLNIVSAFTVGALNGNLPTLPIANFSSRGPSQCYSADSSLFIKPEVSAPGVNVRSSVPGGGYKFFNGTSMAAPHVSGAILLLKEAFPYLTGKDFKLALYYTCTDLGEPGEDNVYGMGVIDVLAAFNYLVAQGNVPVAPFKARDVMLVDAVVPMMSCENEIAPVITVENGGTDTLTSFDVVYQADIFSKTYTWTGALATKERKTLILPGMEAEEGKFELKIALQNPNNLTDERPLNNILVIPVEATNRKRLQAQAEGGNTVCENSSALLRAEFPGPGSLEVNWYDAPFEGSLMGQGQVFKTSALTETDTFFAEAIYTVPVGMKDKSAGENFLADTNNLGIVFNVHFPVKLKSVKVYAEKTGLRLLQLLDENGETVKQGVFSVSEIGEFRIQLNWDLPAGKHFKLLKTGGRPLYLNTSGATFPYTFDGVIDVTGTTDGLAANGAWYFFYDWEIEFTEPCGRTVVPLVVQPGGELPVAQFSVSADSVNLADNEPVQFFNASTGDVASFHWNFGDGTTSSEINPVHQFSAPGKYAVSLVATNFSGCKDFSLTTISVGAPELSNTRSVFSSDDFAEVFPNPVTESISVYFDLAASKPVQLHLTDLTGRILKSTRLIAAQKEVLQLDATDLSSGVYLLLMETEGGRSAWKIVKM